MPGKLFLLVVLGWVCWQPDGALAMARAPENPASLMARAELFVGELMASSPSSGAALVAWFQERKEVSPALVTEVERLMAGSSSQSGPAALAELLGLSLPLAGKFEAVDIFAGREHWTITMRGLSPAGVEQEFNLVFLRGKGGRWDVGRIGVIGL